jgi:hypothetical protein
MTPCRRAQAQGRGGEAVDGDLGKLGGGGRLVGRPKWHWFFFLFFNLIGIDSERERDQWSREDQKR